MDFQKIKEINEEIIDHCSKIIEKGIKNGKINDDYVKLLEVSMKNLEHIHKLKEKGYEQNHLNEKNEIYKPDKKLDRSITMCLTDFEKLIMENQSYGNEETMWSVIKIIGEYLQETKSLNRNKFDDIMYKVKEVLE